MPSHPDHDAGVVYLASEGQAVSLDDIREEAAESKEPIARENSASAQAPAAAPDVAPGPVPCTGQRPALARV